MIVVTGGAGFIGSVLIKRLNDQGHTDIIVVDRLRDGDKWLNLRGLKFLEYIHADEFLTSKYLNKGSFIRAIYHMGACSSTTEKNLDYLMNNNVRCSQTLFSFAAENNIPICYASSAATYGGGELGYNDDQSIIAKLRPLNPYGYSKQLMDEWVLKQKRLPEKWFGVKFFNVFGPNEYHKGRMSSVVYQAFQQIKTVGEVKLFKSHRPDYQDGQQLRDFVYVRDVVEAMIQLIEQPKPELSGIYNLGTGQARSYFDLVVSTFKAMGKETNIKFIDMPEDLRSQYQYFTEAKMDKLKNALPDFKFKSLEEAIHDYVRNHLMTDHPHLEMLEQR